MKQEPSFKIKYLILFVFLLNYCVSNGQHKQLFTQQDTLRGSITSERIWWDLQHYTLAVEVFPNTKFIQGSNKIEYKVLSNNQVMQIDLQHPLKITKVVQDGMDIEFSSVGNAHYLKLNAKQDVGETKTVNIFFEGHPKTAKNAPWDGGFTWKKDENGFDFIATSCQGLGASIWWPNKDHMYDEPDNGIIESYTVPDHLTAVGNGRLIKETLNPKEKTKTFTWQVKNPINNYGVNLNIGNYVSFNETFFGEKGKLDCQYFVLKQDLEKSKNQFKEVKRTLTAFEHWFGPYPFYEDGYKLVQVPYLGMEHQSSVTYGNGFKNGYLGRDLSQTGWGLKFDFIIVHESGHEWFANNITNIDIADMWIHESFTNYSESLFLDFHFGTQAANEYMIGLRKRVQNDIPVIGHYHVNNEGSSDMYFKGSNMLHNIRQIIDNDKKWRRILRGMNKEFYHQTVNTKQIEEYLISKSGKNLQPIFNQYLRSTKIPKLEYQISKRCLEYRWTNCISSFNMPIKISYKDKTKWIKPTTKWKKTRLKKDILKITIDPNFYINSSQLN